MFTIKNNNGGYGYLIRIFITIGDILCLNIACLLIAHLFPQAATAFSTKMVWLLVNISYWPVVYLFGNIHNDRMMHIDWVLVVALRSVVVYALVTLSLLTFFKEGDNTPSHVLLAYFTLFFSLLSLWWFVSRRLQKYFRRKGFNSRNVIIVGAGKTGMRMYRAIRSDEGYGFRFLGFFDDNTTLKETLTPYQGTVADVENFALENKVDKIYCALPGSQDEKILRLIKFSEQHMIQLYIVPELNRYVLKHMHYEIFGDVPVLSLRKEKLEHPALRLLKRTFDLLFSLTVLLLSPLWLLPLALAVKLTSPGPVFFKQRRTGLRGKEFYCYKFRTMHTNQDADRLQATRDDARITPVGHFLRRTNLDELPQFINVLRGDMSVVGPRPHMIKHTEDYSKIIDRYMVRHMVKPGLTGWAQVNGYRGETRELWQMEKRVEYDVWYIENWNFWLDIKIIFLTVVNMIRGEKNAF
ncbi:MAG: undecaprenyl-phosphate glucose phosphotransferase [Coprobacter sp.]|nr:undecaprenyl-phosphate glucose phosphotransferase [Coprobacter sp.]